MSITIPLRPPGNRATPNPSREIIDSSESGPGAAGADASVPLWWSLVITLKAASTTLLNVFPAWSE